ncbi:hypothetical protein BPS13_0193 [Bacillus phage BPS13]|uniref:Uncharacterized protein n=2 Tax=Wphvirus TaxID=1922327 RepID=W5QUR1_9CAUD|nr:hypothetical protein BPS13_0193 [Bacillus phage BPS13]YP_009003078.1 hypothetical protein BPS10C_192 [Bacillus phage BPS10C]AEZ50372.1 hypothetical protein BPS13_0193 [Bacillus phage BPS13]AGI12189.1 hypothetical protein BPS10C_192 [Bacillus phage BPS10C]
MGKVTDLIHDIGYTRISDLWSSSFGDLLELNNLAEALKDMTEEEIEARKRNGVLERE